MGRNIRQLDKTTIMKDSVSILIGADVVPTDSNRHLFESGAASQIIQQDLLSCWNSVDFRVFNLEAPVFDGYSPIKKCGPTLEIGTKCVPGIVALNPDLVLLANNHILDHGPCGLNSTIKELVKYGVNYVGVGEKLESVKKYHEFESKGIRIGIYNCAEHEFSIATSESAGANPFDALTSFDDVAFLRARNDYVIVCFHGGKEFYQYPSPMLQRIFRKFADKGADVVLAQHTHCVGCEERYKNSILIYGQGNFIFENSESLSKKMLLCKLTFTKRNKNIEYIPIQLHDGRCGFSDSAKEDLSAFSCRSQEILEEGFVEKKYRSFAKENITLYLRLMKGNGIVAKVISKVSTNFFLRICCRMSHLLCVRNFTETEAHRELLLAGIKDEVERR